LALSSPGHRLVLVARTEEKAREAKKQVEAFVRRAAERGCGGAPRRRQQQPPPTSPSQRPVLSPVADRQSARRGSSSTGSGSDGCTSSDGDGDSSSAGGAGRRDRSRRDEQEPQHQQPRVLALACDQSSLASVRSFCRELREAVAPGAGATARRRQGAGPRPEQEDDDEQPRGGGRIDALCLNAAVLEADSAEPSYTEDGLERTFQVNHLAPFVMANLLADLVNPDGGRVVFTTSGLHLQFPSLDVSGAVAGGEGGEGEARRGFAMLDGSAGFHYKRAYALSKLCNVAACRELHERFQGGNPVGGIGDGSPSSSSPHRGRMGVVANCFSPGLMLHSGLFRHHGPEEARRRQVSNPLCLEQAKTVAWGAGALAYMAVSDAAGKASGTYWTDDSYLGCDAAYGVEFKPSPLAPAVEDAAQRRKLWELSARLAGLRPEEDLTNV
jgi:NAD(P)-dependent dehydrogenase (short-subunit alcohol dehydrogenase family)